MWRRSARAGFRLRRFTWTIRTSLPWIGSNNGIFDLSATPALIGTAQSPDLDENCYDVRGMAFPGFLRKIDIFRNIGPTELRELLKVLRVRSYPADTPIFNKGDKAQHMFILLSGRVKI